MTRLTKWRCLVSPGLSGTNNYRYYGAEMVSFNCVKTLDVICNKFTVDFGMRVFSRKKCSSFQVNNQQMHCSIRCIIRIRLRRVGTQTKKKEMLAVPTKDVGKRLASGVAARWKQMRKNGLFPSFSLVDFDLNNNHILLCMEKKQIYFHSSRASEMIESLFDIINRKLDVLCVARFSNALLNAP